MALAPGTRLGPYEITARLGAGGMGEVYRARDARLDRDVAIKALPQALAQDGDRRARFEREARALASLNHPNIAAIYGIEDADGAPHLVLELVEGETLEGMLARGPLETKRAVELCVQIAAAVEAAHERGIVHRDLKPGNVMVTTGGTAKVLDFGLAKTGGDAGVPFDPSESPTMAGAGRTLPGLILGTAAYMSPEQARGGTVDRRADVWSFGCVLYECLTGRAPFAGATPSDLIARILEREPDWQALPAGTPARAKDVLRRCLQKDAEERPRDIRDVRLVLAEIAAAGARTEAGAQKSIVVLPFTHAGAADDEFFADGITEEILNALGHVAGLRVAARSSSFAFKGKNADLRTIAEKLDVSTVLEGSVRRSGTRLRITAQLVNAADGYQLWSERYDRELTDVFELQDEIANAIASKLKLTLAQGAERGGVRGTKSLEAYELFLKGRAALYRRGRHILEAQEYFDRALALDPDYAEALAWHSDTFRLYGTFGLAPPHEVMPRAKAMAERALVLDPNLAEAYATLADVESQYDRDFERALANWTRALDIDPRHTRARCERALWGLAIGHFGLEESEREVQRAVADDPLNAWALGMLSLYLGIAERHDESIASGTRAVELDPSSFFAQWNRMRAYIWAGRPAEALELGPALLASSGGRQPWALVLHVVGHAALGHTALARAVYDELEARSRWEYVGPAWVGMAAAALGRTDEALAFVRRAVEERDPFILHARTMPWWDPLRGRPEFAQAIASIRFVGPGLRGS